MPIVLLRTDFRVDAGRDGPYNAMLTHAPSVRLDLPFAAMATVAAAILGALAQLRS